jgi:hypothetical protein
MAHILRTMRGIDSAQHNSFQLSTRLLKRDTWSFWRSQAKSIFDKTRTGDWVHPQCLQWSTLSWTRRLCQRRPSSISLSYTEISARSGQHHFGIWWHVHLWTKRQIPRHRPASMYHLENQRPPQFGVQIDMSVFVDLLKAANSTSLLRKSWDLIFFFAQGMNACCL